MGTKQQHWKKQKTQLTIVLTWKTLLLCPLSNSSSALRRAQSQMTTRRSSLPEARRVPDGLKWSVLTQPEWRSSLPWSSSRWTRPRAPHTRRTNWDEPRPSSRARRDGTALHRGPSSSRSSAPSHASTACSREDKKHDKSLLKTMFILTVDHNFMFTAAVPTLPSRRQRCVNFWIFFNILTIAVVLKTS